MVKVLILGGGFGGIRAALDLDKKLRDLAEVTLIEKNSYHLFTPDLYEVASVYGMKKDPFAVRLKKTICIPYSDIFENKKINFIQAEIFAIDTDNKKVITRGGGILNYDYLIVALGSQSSDFGIPGVREYAFQFKDIEDGLMLNKKINDLTSEVASGARIAPIKIAIAGAGFTGIEVAAELACCVKKIARACNIKDRCERVTLIEAGPKILPMVSDKERGVTTKRLTKLGVEIMENTAVEVIESEKIKFKNGKVLDSDLIIWAAGVRSPDLLKSFPNDSLAENKKMRVNENLEVINLPNIFAVGDSTDFLDPRTGRPVPGLAYIAVDQGKIVAQNIYRVLKNKKMKTYKPFYGVWVAPIGGKYALAHLWGGLNIVGFWGWIVRELIDLRYMLSILPVKKAVSLMWQEVTLFTKND